MVLFSGPGWWCLFLFGNCLSWQSPFWFFANHIIIVILLWSWGWVLVCDFWVVVRLHMLNSCSILMSWVLSHHNSLEWDPWFCVLSLDSSCIVSFMRISLICVCNEAHNGHYIIMLLWDAGNCTFCRLYSIMSLNVKNNASAIYFV